MTTTKKFKCPDCEATFDTAGALGPHRNKAHGYRASDGKNQLARVAKGQNKGGITAENRGKFPCPQCDFVASWTGGLKKHTTAIHNTGKLLCPKCDRTFNDEASLAKHMYHSHRIGAKQRSELIAKGNQNAITVAATNGHIQQQPAQAPDDRDHRIEAIATLACGRFQQIIEGLAFTHDLPPRSLTTLVIRTLGATAKVW